MTREPPPARKPNPWVIGAIVFVVAFDLVFAWQFVARAYDSEFGGHPDEAAHYVTGLMVHDYLARGLAHAPMKFADDFYQHYPKVGLGVWPPFFYVVQSAWTLAAGISRSSLLLLMCALAAIVALLLFRALREEFGNVTAGLGTALFLSLPLIRDYSAMVMAEMLCAALMFGATLALGRYLDGERRADALWFGLLAALAILTKGTGLALVLVVPLALLLTGKWRVLARPPLWLAAALTALLAGPWTWHFRNAGRLKGGWLQPDPSWAFTREALPYYATKLCLALGLIAALLMLIGLAAKLLRSDARTGRWSALAALLASIVIFQAILPVGLEARHLIPALPAAMMFAVAGWAAIAGRFRRGESLGTPVSSAVIYGNVLLVFSTVIALFGTIHLSSRRKGWTGFRPLAELVLADADTVKGSVLVSSDASGEGMFISEVAMAEKRPGHTIARASKLLADMAWSGRNYRAKFADDDALAAFLEDQHLDYIVLDDSVPDAKRGAHHDMLKRVLRDNTGHFREVASAPMTRGAILQDSPIRLYRVLRKN